MRALITGATGFIGSHLASQLHHHGYELRACVRPSSNKVWLEGIPIEYIVCNMSDDATLSEAVTGVDYIYHVAGVTKARTKEEYFEGNLAATRNLLSAAVRHNSTLKRFIHISSLAAVGPGEGGRPVDESTLYHPITTYGVSKMEAEKECLRFMEKIPITICRPPAVYGPRDRDIFEFFNTVNKGLHPMIGFSDKQVSLIHVCDLVRGFILAGEHSAGAGQTFFISSERFYTWKEVGKVTARVLGKRALRVRIPEAGVYTIAAFAELFSLISRKPALLNFEKAKDLVQESWTCDIGKARSEIGFSESLSLEQGVRNTVEWYREQKWLK